MRLKHVAIALAVAVLAAVAFVVLRPSGGGKGPEPIAHGKDACDRCHMKIGRPGYGGEMRNREGVLTKYDDVGCLLLAMWKEHAEVPEVYVEDHGSGELFSLLSAQFVRGVNIETPMGYGILAFRSAEDAKAFAASSGGEVMALDGLLQDPAWFQAREKSRAEGAPLQARPGEARPLTAEDVKPGKDIFMRECASCHGERGDGEGPAAAFLDPKPRDFLMGKFRFRTTAAGAPPATADILRTIEKGAPGTAMPSFAFLTEKERRQVAAYTLEKADLLGTLEPEPVALGAEPPAAGAEALARGKELFKTMACVQCHGAGGKGDGPTAKFLKDDKGRPVHPRDFTAGLFHGGGERKDLFYRITTGMDGSPMVSFLGAIPDAADRWALADYVLSLKAEPKPVAYSSDPRKAGQMVAAKYACRGCHALDDGKGGDVGPDLRLSGQRLGSDWVRAFVQDPRARGKIYPWRAARMPHLGVTAEEAGVIAKYLAAMGKRKDAPAAVPDVAQFPAARLEEGKNFFGLRCAQCHALGKVVETPVAAQQGPDLIGVAGRIDYDWAAKWIFAPKKIDPKTRMIDPGLTKEQVDSVRMFVWKASVESQAASAKP